VKTLASLAAQSNSSASSFQRKFSQIIGESAKQYSLRLQLECAALYLLTSDRSIHQTSLDAGFASHEGFTRAFQRHFGSTPSDFRRQHSALGRNPAHIELARQISPCIGIFRQPNQSTPKGKSIAMSYEIEIGPIEESVFVYQRGRCSHDEIANTLGSLLPAVFEHAMKNGLEFRSPPTTVYPQWGPGMVTMHAGLSVVAAEPADGIEVEVLTATDAAITIHHGSYDGLAEAHAALELHIDGKGLIQAGPVREVYLTDPGETPDPKDWQTQVIMPVASPAQS